MLIERATSTTLRGRAGRSVTRLVTAGRMRVLITGSSGQIGTNLAPAPPARRPRGVRRRQAPERVDGRVPDAAPGPRRPLPGVPRRHRRRRVPGGRPRRAPRRAREGAPARAPAAPRARERDHDVQRPRVRRAARLPLVFSSTREVYGDVHRFEEYAEEAADFAYTESPYSASKITSEAFIYSYARCYGLNYLVFRFSNVYGRYDNDLWRMERVLPLFMHQLSRGEPITIFGGDEKVLDFTFIDDCVDGIARGVDALAEERVANETVNLAYGQGNTLVRAAELIAERARRRAADHDCAVAPRRGHALRRRHPQGARAARLGAADAARRGHPAVGRLVQGVARRASGGGPPVRADARRRRGRAWLQAAGRAPALGTSSRLFGPTASGKTAVAALLRRPARRGGDLRRLGRALRGHPRPDRGARLPGAARRRRAARRGRLRRASTSGSRTRRSTRSLAAGRTPLVVGGTGLYFRAALSELELPPPPAPGARERWQAEYDRLGPEGAHALLAERDPAAAARVHANDRRRVVRALELAEAGALARAGGRPPLGRRHAPPDDARRARPAARRARPPHRRPNARDGRARRRRRGARAWAQPLSDDRAQGARARGSSRRCRSTRRSSSVVAATRRLAALPAQVAAPDAGRRYARRRPATGGDRR